MALLHATALLTLAPLAFAQTYAVYRSLDQGASWTPARHCLPTNCLPTDIRINALHRSGPNFIAATGQGIYVSKDQAKSWQLARPNVRALSLTSINSQTYAGATDTGLLRSLDHGAHWQLIAQLQFRYVRSLVADKTGIYSGTGAQGIFHRGDNGATWTRLSQGLPLKAQIFSMVVHQGVVHAALYRQGLYILDPQRKIWTRTGEVVPLALASSGVALIAGQNPGGIYTRHDPGNPWMAAKVLNMPLLDRAPVWALAAHKSVALAGIGPYLYRSTNYGGAWLPVERGIPTGATAIAFDLSDANFLAVLSQP
jgi:hypothetical protein